MILLSFSIERILVNIKSILKNHNYLFQPNICPVISLSKERDMFASITDVFFYLILIRKATQKPISIPACTKHGKIYN